MVTGLDVAMQLGHTLALAEVPAGQAFGNILGSGLSIILLICGAIVTLFSLLFFLYLVLGGIGGWLSAAFGSSGRPPQQG